MSLYLERTKARILNRSSELLTIARAVQLLLQ